MRHEAAGITGSAYPKTIRLGGVDCAATYLHEPGDARDGNLRRVQFKCGNIPGRWSAPCAATST